MGIIQQFLSGIAGAPPLSQTFIAGIEHSEFERDGLGAAFKADDCYVELYLESYQVGFSRRFAQKFHPIVYSFIRLDGGSGPDVKFANVSRATNLAALDESALGRVISVSNRIFGPSPYRGGPISMELGLFAAKGDNVVTPVLEYITSVADAGGISFVSAAKPFLPLVTKGMALLAGQPGNIALQVGLDTDHTPRIGHLFAIVDKPAGDQSDKYIALGSGELILNGSAIKDSFALFSLRSVGVESDWGNIPDLDARVRELDVSIRNGDFDAAEAAWTSLRRAALTSPDITLTDAKRISKAARLKLDMALSPTAGPTASSSERGEEAGLAGLRIYERDDL